MRTKKYAEIMLKGYQWRAIDAVTSGKNKQCALHMDAGLGKTITVLYALKQLLDAGEIKNALVVGPIKVIETVWMQEAKKWAETEELTFSLVRGNPQDRAFALHRKADIYLMNYELMGWLNTFLQRKIDTRFDMVVLDESTRIKDRKTGTFKAISGYGHPKGVAFMPSYKRSVTMTGTPTPQSLMDLWSQFFFLDKGKRLYDKFSAFRSRFFDTAYMISDGVGKYVVKEGAMGVVADLIKDITVELSSKDYGSVPPVVPVPHYVELPAGIRTRYRQLERDAILELSATNILMAAHGGAKVMMCHQIANGAIYQNGAGTPYDVLHNEKINCLLELLKDLNRNTLIVYKFKHDLERLRAALPGAVVLKGKDVSVIIDRWNAGEIPQLLLHPQGDAHGLNLQGGGNHVIFFSLDYSAERYLQMCARLARTGQTQGSVFAHRIVCRNTVDEIMEEVVERRITDQDTFRGIVKKYREKYYGTDF